MPAGGGERNRTGVAGVVGWGMESRSVVRVKRYTGVVARMVVREIEAASRITRHGINGGYNIRRQSARRHARCGRCRHVIARAAPVR